MALWICGLPAGAVLALAARAHAVRLAGWRPWVAASRPILWILHVAYAWIPWLAAARVHGRDG